MMDLIKKTWHTCSKKCFQLTAQLLKPLSISLRGISTTWKKKKHTKKRPKSWSEVIEILRTLVVSRVISPLLRMVCEIIIGALSRKFCPVLHGIIFFLVS